jgi:guanylate kinase
MDWQESKEEQQIINQNQIHGNHYGYSKGRVMAYT